LETLSRKRLSADQNGLVERIKTLKKQAEDQFERDNLVTAVELTKKTSKLAEDLVWQAR
jgi:hypothetical protein